MDEQNAEEIIKRLEAIIALLRGQPPRRAVLPGPQEVKEVDGDGIQDEQPTRQGD